LIIDETQPGGVGDLESRDMMNRAVVADLLKDLEALTSYLSFMEKNDERNAYGLDAHLYFSKLCHPCLYIHRLTSHMILF
jgi:hypothetical protein